MFPEEKIFFWKKKNATAFVISITMAGNFGTLDQRRGKFLPRCNIDMISDYWDLKNRPETQRKGLTFKRLIEGQRGNQPHGRWRPNR